MLCFVKNFQVNRAWLQWERLQQGNEKSAWRKSAFFSAPLSLLLLVLCSCSSLAAGHVANSRLVGQPTPLAHLLYVAIGASDTYGEGADDPQAESWPADLATQLGSNVRLVNLGVPGILLHQALDVEVPVALDTHPQLITIWLAVNDLANNVPVASYTHDLNLLLTRLQAGAPAARIAIANVPDLTLLPYFSAFDTQILTQQILAYNAAILSLAKRHAVLLVDLYSRWQDLASHPEYISNDGLHPSTLGYSRIADLFFQALSHSSS